MYDPPLSFARAILLDAHDAPRSHLAIARIVVNAIALAGRVLGDGVERGAVDEEQYRLMAGGRAQELAEIAARIASKPENQTSVPASKSPDPFAGLADMFLDC